jgi:uncharacterized membrane protein YeaQ/YmgE (transglycosylase-associated protein family)
MNIDVLIAILLTTAICAGLAFVATLLLKSRVGLLSLIGAGLFGQQLGGWLGAAVHGTQWPYTLVVGGASVHLLWTFVGALGVLLLFRLIPGRSK